MKRKKRNSRDSARGRPGVQLEDVRDAAVRLLREKRFVGPVNIRLELGTGSYTTIQRHLRQLGLAPTLGRKTSRRK